MIVVLGARLDWRLATALAGVVAGDAAHRRDAAAGCAGSRSASDFRASRLSRFVVWSTMTLAAISQPPSNPAFTVERARRINGGGRRSIRS